MESWGKTKNNTWNRTGLTTWSTTQDWARCSLLRKIWGCVRWITSFVKSIVEVLETLPIPSDTLSTTLVWCWGWMGCFGDIPGTWTWTWTWTWLWNGVGRKSGSRLGAGVGSDFGLVSGPWPWFRTSVKSWCATWTFRGTWDVNRSWAWFGTWFESWTWIGTWFRTWLRLEMERRTSLGGIRLGGTSQHLEVYLKKKEDLRKRF